MKRQAAVDPPRDRWGRPTIDGTTYTRASTLAKMLEDQSGLIRWSARMAALGMSRNPDLVALAATTQPDDTKALDSIAERAKERAGSTSGRDTGTSIHAATEALDYGEPTRHLPGDLLADATAYSTTLVDEKLEPVLAETFVINEAVQAAGSFDRLLWHSESNDYLIGDIKTGTKDDPRYALRYSGLSWAIQLATYANGVPWRGDTQPWQELSVDPPRLDTGLILYIPRGSGKCYPLWIDLKVGWEAAQVAAQVARLRKLKVSA